MHHYLERLDVKKILETTSRENINTLHQLSFMLTSNEEYIEDYIPNTRHKLYLLYIKPIELTSNIEESD